MSLQEGLWSLIDCVLDPEHSDSLGLQGDHVVRFVGGVLHRRISALSPPVELLLLPLGHILVVG